jgi:small-conductance mechanosensitive channel
MLMPLRQHRSAAFKHANLQLVVICTSHMYALNIDKTCNSTTTQDADECIIALKSDIQQLQQAAAVQQNAHTALTQQSDANSSTVSTLQTQLAAAHATIADLQIRAEAADTLADILEQKRGVSAKLIAKCDAAKAAVAAANATTEQLRAQCSALQQQLDQQLFASTEARALHGEQLAELAQLNEVCTCHKMNAVSMSWLYYLHYTAANTMLLQKSVCGLLSPSNSV